MEHGTSIKTKYGEVYIYAETIENEAMTQIIQMANSPIGKNAHIRIMPDCHAGAGCVIGTTMKITDKVCPNLVGVDIGCGVDLVHTDIDFKSCFERLDEVIRKYIPFGMECHKSLHPYDFTQLRCWDSLTKEVRDLSQYALGTLGGGNHFIEAYDDGWLSVHSGSRNIGYKVAEFYQRMAVKSLGENSHRILEEQLKSIEPSKREQWLKGQKIFIDKDLAYLQGDLLDDYLHDIKIIQDFAVNNRQKMLTEIIKHINGAELERITSTHNYIDTEQLILRKGAISARAGEKLVIPLNMRDGILLCVGKGNSEWNYSAPHGAGRLYTRARAKELFTLDEYAKEMEGIYSSCISRSTIDEAPFVYKDWEEIMRCIEPMVEIIERLRPIYNFKAG